MKSLVKWVMSSRAIATIAVMGFGAWVFSEAIMYDHFVAVSIVMIISLGCIWGGNLNITGDDDSENKSI